MIYTDDAGIVSKSAEGLVKVMTVIVAAFEFTGLTVSEKKRVDASTNTKPGHSRPTACFRRSMPEVVTNSQVFVPRRHYPRKR